MDTTADRKLFLGGRLKRLRRDLSLTQTAMAADLGVSPSYLNHIERNQRPVSAQLLLRLAETYDVDLRTLGQSGGTASEAELAEAFADPLFQGLTVPRHEIVQMAEDQPRRPTPCSVSIALFLTAARAIAPRRAETTTAPPIGSATISRPAPTIFQNSMRWARRWPRRWMRPRRANRSKRGCGRVCNRCMG